ncbi:PadR family transcriptional regulator [Companilactobacillus sp. HBUAS59699]|uniref:PadR family transcriptional regulator n=1 Tax=Companilactobacillus sp. HBUAS59699 TaxID=3109358 RepID=UPI002FEF974F
MPKKRVLPYILLGLINNQAKLTGYQISQEFNNEIGEFWHASHSQIYPELQRMIDDGWVMSDEESSDSKSTYYVITDKGNDALSEWLNEPLSEKDDLFSLKLYFVKDKHDSLMKKLIQQQLKINSAHYSHLLERKKLLFSKSSDIESSYGHYLILSSAIERESNHIKWLNDVLEELK